MMQTTICNPVSCYGIGVHSGQRVQLTLKPAKVNTGIVFIRTDVKSVDNVVYAAYNNVVDTSLATTIANSANITISTIEHLMAAIWGCGVDNLIIEIDGPEVPIMDGSSKQFVFMLECAGYFIQNVAKKRLKLLKETTVTDGHSEIIAFPADNLTIDLTIEFSSKAIGKQQIVFSDPKSFKNDIADSRTFGFIRDLEYLYSKGLAKGASLDNAIGIDDNGVILNHDGARHNEFVKHKLIDICGDLYASGNNILANITGYKTSHHLNNEFLRKIFSDPDAYKFV